MDGRLRTILPFNSTQQILTECLLWVKCVLGDWQKVEDNAKMSKKNPCLSGVSSFMLFDFREFYSIHLWKPSLFIS